MCHKRRVTKTRADTSPKRNHFAAMGFAILRTDLSDGGQKAQDFLEGPEEKIGAGRLELLAR